MKNAENNQAPTNRRQRFVLLGMAGLLIVTLASGCTGFTAQHAPSAGSITPSPIQHAPSAGNITEFPLPTSNSHPYEIAAGPDGKLWFTDTGSTAIGRISPSGTVTEFPVPTPNSSPGGITAGPDGNLWFTEENKIGRITSGK